jgi:hypothetical protein
MMEAIEPFEEPQLLYRQVITYCGDILGVNYEVDYAVVYLADGSFYLEYPKSVQIENTGGLILSGEELLSLKSQLLVQSVEELKRAPYYAAWFFGFRYIPNPDYDPDFVPGLNPFEEWGA